MSTELQEFLHGLTASEALKFVCLFLAQNDEPQPPHVELGFASQSEAFAKVGEKFQTKPRTIQNERDAFDKFTDSSRVGWDKPLPPRLIPVFEKYSGLSRGDMSRMSQNILSRNWSGDMSRLPDLLKIMKECIAAVEALDVSSPVKVRPDVWEKIVVEFGKKWDVTIVDETTMIAQNDKGQRNFISAQELPVAKAVVPYFRALNIYREVLDEFSQALGFGSRTNGVGKRFFSRLPAEDWVRILSQSNQVRDPLAVLTEILPDPVDLQRMEALLSDPSLSGGKKFDRSTDWMESGMKRIGNWISEASSGRVKLVKALYHIEDLDEAIAQSDPISLSLEPTALKMRERINGGLNFINYGAPGTGKSHKISEEAKKLGIVPTTTVFHPDVQNSDFVGTLKPVVTDGDVGYAFSPGPFLKAYVEAWSNPEKPVWFVIEELNRAPAAAVFGELFLLLDREADGSGKYQVDYPSLECEAWINAQIPETISDRPSKLKLPSNLTIAATLNSADQGVYPLDTAFRRRWTQNYVKLDYAQGPDKRVKFIDKDGTEQEIHWRLFVVSLNGVMESHGVREDRLLGPWFVNEHELEGGAIPGKVLVYLWDDLFRNHDKTVVFSHKGSTYGGLVDAIENGKSIFSPELLAALSDKVGL